MRSDAKTHNNRKKFLSLGSGRDPNENRLYSRKPLLLSRTFTSSLSLFHILFIFFCNSSRRMKSFKKKSRRMKSGLAPKYSKDQFSKAKVTQLSSLKEVIENIKKRLNTNQMKLFSESCFGHFLKMHDIKFSGALVHHLLLRQMKSQRTGEMWFTFGGKQARFGKTEFCLISGLSFGEPLGSGRRRFPRTTRLQHECFNGEKNITVATLQDMFMKSSTWSDEDTVKVALLYFLYFVLLGEERRLLVDDFHLELVDCLDAFNSYPWGSESFDKTLSNLQNAFSHGKRHSVNKQTVKSLQKASTTYTLHGFPCAFQVWAFEVIPSLGLKFAVKRGSMHPRILNWECNVIISYNNLKKAVFDRENLLVNVHLRPTEVEKELDYYKGIRFLLEGSVCIQSSESDAETGPAESESHSKGGNTSTALPSDDESENIEAARDNAFSRILPPTSAPTAPGASLTGHGISTEEIMAKIGLLDSKIDAIKVDQQTMRDDVIAMMVDLTKHVTTLKHSQEAEISVLDSKIDAIRVDQQEMKDHQGHLVRMLVDLTKHVTVMKHSQAGPSTTNLVDESAIGVNANIGNESTKHDNHSDPNVNEDFLVVSSSNPTDANKDGDGTGDTSVEMSDWEGDITRGGHTRNLSSLGTGEEEPETKRARMSSNDTILPSKCDHCGRTRHDKDYGGVGSYLILVENLEKELTPLRFVEFVREQASISCKAFIFPCLSSETSARGYILLENKMNFEKLCGFLENPNHIIVSSSGRPLLITEKTSVPDTIRASLDSLFHHEFQEMSWTNNTASTSYELRIVYSGTVEYRMASELRDLFKEFSGYHKGLHKRWAFKEDKILQLYNAQEPSLEVQLVT